MLTCPVQTVQLAPGFWDLQFVVQTPAHPPVELVLLDRMMSPQSLSSAGESVEHALSVLPGRLAQGVGGMYATDPAPRPDSPTMVPPVFSCQCPGRLLWVLLRQPLTVDTRGTFCGGSAEDPTTLSMSISEIPRLGRFPVPLAFSAWRGHFLRWLATALVDALGFLLLLSHPQSHLLSVLILLPMNNVRWDIGGCPGRPTPREPGT